MPPLDGSDRRSQPGSSDASSNNASNEVNAERRNNGNGNTGTDQSSSSSSAKDTPPAKIGTDGSISFGAQAPAPDGGGGTTGGTGGDAKPGVTHDASGHVTKVTYANGQSTQFGYDASGTLNQITRSNGEVDKLDNGVWTTAGGFGGMDQVGPTGATGGKNPPADLSNVQVNNDGSWSYSTKEGANYKFDPNGASTVTSDGGKIVVNTQPNGSVSDFTIDGKTYKQGPNHSDWVDKDGNVSNYTNVNVTSSGFQYTDKQTGQSTNIAPDGSTNVTTVDQNQVFLDSQGHVTRTLSAQGGSTAFTYDANGGIDTFTDQKGNVYKSSTDGTWKDAKGDAITNLKVTQQGDTTYNNSDGQLVVDNVNGTSFTTKDKVSPFNVQTDAQGNPTSATYADGSTRTFKYNAQGELTSFTEKDSDGQSNTYSMQDGKWQDSAGHNMLWQNVSVDGSGDFST
ncbi:MAG: RHS repeat domain-containing protein, partial [Terriglobales bacterium]